MKFLADENFNGHLYDALCARLPVGSLTRVQDVGLLGSDDATILEWAAKNGHIILTHDVTTFAEFAYARVAKEQEMPGVFQVKQGIAIPIIVDEIEMAFECSTGGDWKDRVSFVPF